MSFQRIQPANETSNGAVTVDPADYVPVIDNPYLPLEPGTTFTTESPDGTDVDKFVVTRHVKIIEGVACVVVRDTATEDGQVIEQTLDYFAQDKSGNVWYFGEDTKEFENGKIVSTAGTWRAGVDDATPGIIMLAEPRVGQEYDQENAIGVAEDHAEVLALGKTVTVPYGTFHRVLQTLESSPLDPGVEEEKFYARGVGFLSALDVDTGERSEQLVSIEVDGTDRREILHGYAGGDEIRGFGGRDEIDGLGGRDTLFGGTFNDTLDGGDDDVADLLHGGSGRDTMRVDRNDRAFGESGNDLFQLSDKLHFGSIDGGGQDHNNLRLTFGDVLQFDGVLNLAAVNPGERVVGIESVSMADGGGGDALRLSLGDVLDIGDGVFDPVFRGQDGFGQGDAVRILGDEGDKVQLSGGDWLGLDATNAPDGFAVYGAHGASGDAYLLIQEAVGVVST